MDIATKEKIIQLFPKKYHPVLFKFKLYLKAPRLIYLSKKVFAQKQRPVMIVSLPRSGSSWVGAMFSTCDEVRYMREPITTSYMQKQKGRVSVFDQESCQNWQEYQIYIQNCLANKPNFGNGVLTDIKQWLNPNTKKTTIIKEVNPLVLSHYISHISRLIYLIRHPFSVAKSYSALNWKNIDLFSQRFNDIELKKILTLNENILSEDHWYQMGYLQGWIEAKIKSELPQSSAKIVRYENISSHPHEQFHELFEFANISAGKQTNEQISLSVNAEKKTPIGKFSLTRRKQDISTFKVQADEETQYNRLMEAYKKSFNDYKKINKMEIINSQNTNVSPSYQ